MHCQCTGNKKKTSPSRSQTTSTDSRRNRHVWPRWPALRCSPRSRFGPDYQCDMHSARLRIDIIREMHVILKWACMWTGVVSMSSSDKISRWQAFPDHREWSATKKFVVLSQKMRKSTKLPDDKLSKEHEEDGVACDCHVAIHLVWPPAVGSGLSESGHATSRM